MSNVISSGRTTLPGSAHAPAVGARNAEPLAADAPVEVTVRVRLGAEPPAFDPAVSRDEIERHLASNPADIARVEAFAQSGGLHVQSSNALEHAVVLSGTAEQMQSAFGVSLEDHQGDAGAHIEQSGDISIPSDLDGVVTGVFGLDDREASKSYLVHPNAAPAGTFTPLDLAKTYQFPDGDGTGEHIAVISLGGRYDDATQAKYLAALGVPHKAWHVSNVDGGPQNPADNGPTGENMLDAEIIGAVVPAADKTMYIAPNTDRGFIDAISKAVHDPAHKNTIVSISWGGPEEAFTPQARHAFDELFAEAKSMGVNVFTAAGDNGSADGIDDGATHVDFPSASPSVISVGGTKLFTNADGSIKRETVWNELANGDGATGGGISSVEPKAPGQQKLQIDGRGVPDIAGDADPLTGYRVLEPTANGPVGMVVAGTSAPAPLNAALAARLEQNLGRPIGDLHGAIYAAPASAFHDVTVGSNGAYKAAPGWDPVTGRGSVNGAALLDSLRSSRAIG